MTIIHGYEKFVLKLPERETDSCGNEKPQPEITIEPFAIGQYEVTVNEWNACVKDKGCEKRASEILSNKNHPITNVSWNDAQDYVNWLNSGTGKDYRLPFGAEWEYAARGNTKTCRWWGDELGRGKANCEACGLT